MDRKPVRKPSHEWHAVTVVLCTSSCAAATMCRNTRFLSANAPKLPLPSCEHPEQCECTYRHFEDRRTGPRRSGDLGASSAGAGPRGERRGAKGRRARDKN